MKYDSSHKGSVRCKTRRRAGQASSSTTARRRVGPRFRTREERSVDSQTPFRPIEYAAPRPLAQLLQCPPETGGLLNQAARELQVEAGEIIFRQGGVCQGLYVIVSGLFTRKAERHQTRLALGPARPGELVELGAALGNGLHTFTLSAQSAGALLQLPIDALHSAFDSFPPLRMQLLEELAREVSRGYFTCTQNPVSRPRRRNGDSTPA